MNYCLCYEEENGKKRINVFLAINFEKTLSQKPLCLRLVFVVFTSLTQSCPATCCPFLSLLHMLFVALPSSWTLDGAYSLSTHSPNSRLSQFQLNTTHSADLKIIITYIPVIIFQLLRLTTHSLSSSQAGGVNFFLTLFFITGGSHESPDI